MTSDPVTAPDETVRGDRGHGADVDLDGIDSTLAPTRVARFVLDALLGSLPRTC